MRNNLNLISDQEIDERKPEVTLKFKRNLPLAFSLVAFLSSLAIIFGDQPIVAYIFS